MTGGNIASLNIQVTSNIAGAQTQLNNLQRTLQQIRSGGSIFPNLNQTLTQLQGINRSMSNFGSSTATVSQQFLGMSTNGSLVTNMLLGWSALSDVITRHFREAGASIYLAGRYGMDAFKGAGRSIMSFFSTWRPLTAALRAQPMAPPTLAQQNGGLIIQQMSLMQRLSAAGTAVSGHFRNIVIPDIRTAFQGLGQTLVSLGAMIWKIGTIATAAIAIAAAASVIYLTAKFAELLAMGIKYNAMMEQNFITMDVLMTGQKDYNGELMRTQALMSQMKRYADWSSYTSPQVIEGGKLLMNYGVQAKDVMHVLRMLGDTSAGNAEKFKSQTLVFGQIFARGKVTGDNLKQLTEAGINPLQELVAISKELGENKTYATFQKEMEDGKVSVDQLVQALEYAVSEKGRFNNMQLRLADTGTGMWSTLKDKTMTLIGESTLKLFEALKPTLAMLIKLTNTFLDNIDEIGTSISTNLIPPINQAVKEMMNLVGMTGETADGFDGITSAVDVWTKALGSAIKVFMFIINISSLLFGSLLAGFAVIGSAWETLTHGMAVIIQSLVLAIVGAFEWAWKKVYNMLIDYVQTPMANTLNWFSEKFGQGKIMDTLQSNKYGTNNNAWDLMGQLNSEQLAQWKKDMKGVVDLFDTGKTLVNGSWSNLMGDTSGVDKFIAGLTGNRPMAPDNQKGISNVTSGLEDAAKAAEKLQDELTGIIEKLTSVGNVFEKLTYEKFSPSKLMYRITRFIKEMAAAATNINQLVTAGMPKDMANELRAMGIQGYGIAKGLSQTPDAQRQEIYKMYGGIKEIGTQSAIQQVAFEHSGSITVNGVTNEGQLKSVAIEISKRIYDQAPTYVDPNRASYYNLAK